MMRTFARALASALLLAVTSISASAASSMDASAFSCKELTDKDQSSSKSAWYGASVILYWMAGYHHTEEQAAIVDFDNMLKEFTQTTEYCAKNPGISVMTASSQFMGEHSVKATEKAIDLAIIKCEAINTTKDDETDGLGQILMWLAGYHTSVGESTMIDMDKFGKDVEKMAVYCTEHPEVGLFTTSEKFMGEPADDAKDESKE
jgi:acid stress chaperone HdeB